MDYRFKQSNAEIRTIKGVQFSVVNPEFMKKISVTQPMEFGGREIQGGITSDNCYDQTTGLANLGAINDPRMGSVSDLEHPGYFGHIELITPVYHINFIKIIINILKCVSFYTSELLVSKKNYIIGRKNIKDMVQASKSIKKCPTTDKKLPLYTKEGTKIAINHGNGKEIISPKEVYDILKKISDEDVRYMGFDPDHVRPEWFIIKVIPVPPLHVRPSVFMSSSQKCDDDLTTKINEIVKANNGLSVAIKKYNQDKTGNNHFISQLEALLQYNVNTLMDNQHPEQPPSLQRSGKPLKTFKERLSGKEGRVRGNLMGKRSDFTARTVITADPNLSIDEVGVPIDIAMNLTFPETVTYYNKEKLIEYVKNGPNKYPGAKFIIKNGQKYDLKIVNIKELENGWVIERHLINGDFVLFNRQPSLHKMSIMGHKVRVLPKSTFRLNLACTSPYNADFDGDEMNMHVPQSLTAKAEIENLMMVNSLIVSPQSNKPVIGIIQDSLLSSCKMSRRSVFIDKFHLMNILTIIDWNGGIPNPALIIRKNGKEYEYWTGKQVLSLIIPKTVYMNNLKDKINPLDKGILIQNGKILSGSMDKSVIGKSQGGIIHILFNDYGQITTKNFINLIQKISNYWVKQHGFTIGIGDAIPSVETKTKVNDILKNMKNKIKEEVENNTDKDPRIIEEFINAELNAAVSEAGKKSEESLNFDTNNFKATVSSGSKGSSINISQIMAAVGQQNVEGRRINYGFKNRTLPHYSKNDIGQESKGFVENSYVSGLTPQEFFFHAMAGREGLIDTACKTSETGYIQRRLVKALEDVSVKYDRTVRNSKGLIIQYLYGDDGIDATYMENVHIKMLNYNLEELKNKYYNEELPEEFEVIKETQRELIKIAKYKELNSAKLNDDYFTVAVNIYRIIKYAENLTEYSNEEYMNDLEMFQEVNNLCERISHIFDPVDLVEGPEISRSFNATRLFRLYIRSEMATMRIRHLTKSQFIFTIEEIEFKFRKTIVQAGEMVGILAAQSIGEPATQMTLNTFHYAGVSAKNVTLGVPRLKELINVTKKLKTPSLTMYNDNSVSEYNQVAQKRIMENVRSNIEYKTIQDIIVSSDIVKESDPEYLKDQTTINVFKKLYAETDSPIHDDFLSLRLEFSSKNLEYVDTSMIKLANSIESVIGSDYKIICSDDNDVNDNLFIRIISSQDDNIRSNFLLRKVEIQCMNIKIKGYEGIEKVYIREGKYNNFSEQNGHYTEKQWVFETEGTNMIETFVQEKINHHKTISNNIVEIYEILGIEAARQALLNELKIVLSFDGSYVNYRHLEILVDTMTARGHITSVTRHGLNRGNTDSGPLTKCTFEETVEVLTEAAAFGEYDPLKGVSDNIMFGQTVPCGTGVLDVLYDLDVKPDIIEIHQENTNNTIKYIPSEPEYEIA